MCLYTTYFYNKYSNSLKWNVYENTIINYIYFKLIMATTDKVFILQWYSESNNWAIYLIKNFTKENVKIKWSFIHTTIQFSDEH